MGLSFLPTREIFVADNEPLVCELLSDILSAEGFDVQTFSDGSSLLAAARISTPVCILIDLVMPGESGLDVLRKLEPQTYGAPIIVMSGYGDIPTAVAAITQGASDFIEKPFDSLAIRTCVANALVRWRHPRMAIDARAISKSQLSDLDLLTAREREVLTEIVAGASSKEAARHLGIANRTVEVHRAHIMEKLGAKNVADLVRIALSRF